MSSIRPVSDYRNWYSLDIESSGVLPEHALQPWSKDSWLTSIAYATFVNATGGGHVPYAAVWPINPTDVFTQMEKIHQGIHNVLQSALQPRKWIIGWNVAFDVAWLIREGYRDQVMGVNWLDAMLMWKHLTRIPESDINRNNRKKYGLKEAVKEFFPDRAGYEEGIDFHSTEPEAVYKRLQYNRQDAAITLDLARVFMSKLCLPERAQQLRSFLIECSSIPLVADHYCTGLVVNRDAGKQLGVTISAELDTLRTDLEARGATEKVMASPAQLSRLLFDDWKLPSLKTTPAGAQCTDKNVLYELSFMDDRAKLIQRFRELKGLRTKFVDNVLESCAYNSDGRTHPTANINSTYTGRMTFNSSILKNKEKRQTGFAIHQMKRAPEYRRLITAPEGYTIVEWDAAGQEYRWVAIESGDPIMLDLCQPGEDPHSYMGAQIAHLSYDDMRNKIREGDAYAKTMRQAGKVGNLSCQYRIGAPSLLTRARVDYELDWGLSDAKKVYETYHGTYVWVKKWWQKKIQLAQQKGYAETLAGRRVILEGNWRNSDQSWALESSAINFPIQGVGADQKYLAMACIQTLLKKYSGKFYFELHDGLYAIFPDNVAEKAAVEGRRVLSNLPYSTAWGFTPPIPLPWDAKMGKNWGDLINVGGEV